MSVRGHDITDAMVMAAAKAAHEAERAKYIADGEEAPGTWDTCVADASLWGGEENFTLDEVLGFYRVALVAALAAREANEPTVDTERPETQRLIEIIVSGVSEARFDGILCEVQAMMDERWPELGPAVAGTYTLEQEPER